MGSIMRKNYGKTFGVFEFWKGKVSKSGCIAQVEKGNDLFLITVELQIATQKGVRYFLSKTITFFLRLEPVQYGTQENENDLKKRSTTAPCQQSYS